MHRVISTDGVTLALHDLGGDGPPILFAHATGLCAGVWAPVAAALADRWHCLAVDLRGHGDSEAPPGLDWHWRGITADVAAAAASLGPGPIHAVGHSGGGAAVLMAAAADPALFRATWCFEPILWADNAAARPRAERLAAGALRRRSTFASREEVIAAYGAKPPFSALHLDALAAYARCGFADQADGTVALRCRPEVEAAIYRQGVNHDGFTRLGAVTGPAVVAWGGDSPADVAAMCAAEVAALPHGRALELPGLGHFGPLEGPARVAAAIEASFVP